MEVVIEAINIMWPAILMLCIISVIFLLSYFPTNKVRVSFDKYSMIFTSSKPSITRVGYITPEGTIMHVKGNEIHPGLLLMTGYMQPQMFPSGGRLTIVAGDYIPYAIIGRRKKKFKKDKIHIPF